MTNNQFERRMQFIVEQQAQFTVDIQQLKEAHKSEASLWREKHQSLNDAVTALLGIVGRLAKAQDRLAKAQDRTDEQLSELTNKQAETDDRLNALIGVVERYFSGNGASPKKRRSKTGGVRKPKKGSRR